MGIFNQTLYEDALSRSMIKHDGIAVGAAFIRFLLEPQEEQLISML